MLTTRICFAVCATVLLVAGLGGQPAQAKGCLRGLKGLLCGRKGSGQNSYAILADHLFETTQSAELADNAKAAGSLLSQRPDSKPGVVELAQAFGALKGDSSDHESFCSKDNLANLRRVAEGMRDGGNLGPNKVTGAILRLNNIVLMVIEDAREFCDPYLTGKWPKPWQPNFSEWHMQFQIDALDKVADSFIYEGFIGLTDPQSDEREFQAGTLSMTLRRCEQLAANPADPDATDISLTEDRTEIAANLREHFYRPCSEFVRFDEAREVLAPFNDMLRSWFVASTGLMGKYYENKDAYRPDVNTGEFDRRALFLAASYGACQRFLASPAEGLAKMISKYRAHDRLL